MIGGDSVAPARGQTFGLGAVPPPPKQSIAPGDRGAGLAVETRVNPRLFSRRLDISVKHNQYVLQAQNPRYCSTRCGGSKISLPTFDADGLLPPGDYELTIEELEASLLVVGPAPSRPTWDTRWRARLVDNLGIMVDQLTSVGITEIFIDGSFVEDKDHPNDIDGYFVCDLRRLASGDLQRELNLLDPHKVWTWDPASRQPHRGYPKRQLPMWHVYRVELYPHVGQLSGIRDRFGNELEFPSAFRLSRRDGRPRGIIKIKIGAKQ